MNRPIDSRSDLYSLGVTLWVMVTGQTPFRGTSAEVMYQHQHAPLPLGQLKDVPQPAVVLLEKDPTQRFQTPSELLKTIPTITDAAEARRGISRQNLQKTPSTASRVETRKRPTRLGAKKISLARLPITGSDLFGREEDIAFLDDAWANQQISPTHFRLCRSTLLSSAGSPGKVKKRHQSRRSEPITPTDKHRLHP